MIRVATFDSYDDKPIAKLCQLLYQAFAVGCEFSGQVRVPDGVGDPPDAATLLEKAPKVLAYSDDKVLYLTTKKLKDRALPSGNAPTHGFAQYTKERALVSTAGIKNLEDNIRLVARHALHQLGHLWDLHHCLDPRCAMYPTWTPLYPQGDSVFCVYCREKSDQKVRLAKS